MALSKSKLTTRKFFQIGLFLLGILLIFFTYFYKNKEIRLVEKKEPKKTEDIKEMPAITLPFKMPEMLTTKKTGKKKKKKHKKLGFEEF